MKEYDFTLKFQLPHSGDDPEAFVEALLREGCDDATIGLGMKGRIVLDFIRSASSAEVAIGSAIQAVKRAIPGAEIIEAAPDFVSLGEIAVFLHCTRQNVQKTAAAYSSEFPAPIHSGSANVYHLAPVLNWWESHHGPSVDHKYIEVADVNRRVNLLTEARQTFPEGMLPAFMLDSF